jgi:hypothetical protein
MTLLRKAFGASSMGWGAAIWQLKRELRYLLFSRRTKVCNPRVCKHMGVRIHDAIIGVPRIFSCFE